ncbi:MAG TPA: 50S ribosomal protein L11 methyltransferase [Polyangiaceae bacterium]|nr:50S ribosomal protein L11 methyltransferase [Polyangiaceae bacterium]
MYDLHDYARMIADPRRMGPYVRALEAVVRPGSVIVDVGAGTGIFSLVACRLGARRVYAIETNEAVEVARELARENGCADRIVFFQADARDVELPERADVVVSDLRGALPLYADHLAVIADARARWLKPGGVLVPERDSLVVAAVDAPDLYARALGPPVGPLGVTLESMRAHLRNATLYERAPGQVEPLTLVTESAPWATLDYASVVPATIRGHVELRVTHPGQAHGLVVWFETVLTPGHGFASVPGEENCYGRVFLPWPHAVTLSKGDVVAVDLWAQPDGDPWGWNSSISGGGDVGESFKQSSFLAHATRPVGRSRPSDAFVERTHLR